MDAERHFLHIVEPPIIPIITGEEVRRYFADFILKSIPPTAQKPPAKGRAIHQETRALIRMFNILKEKFAYGDPDLTQKETWIVRATTWDGLAVIAREMLEIALETSQGLRENNPAAVKADNGVFYWQRVNRGFELAKRLQRPFIICSKQVPEGFVIQA